MATANKQIRRMAKGNEVPFWKIADELKVSEPTFTRLMRRPLPEKVEAQIIGIIERLKEDEE